MHFCFCIYLDARYNIIPPKTNKLANVVNLTFDYKNSINCFFPEIVESPESVTVIVNASAVFRCATFRTDYQLWRVNGTSFYRLPREFRENVNTTQETDGPNELYKMTILSSLAEYNQTTVQCEAGDDTGDQAGQSDVTVIATLMIQGIQVLMYTCHLVEFDNI